jgi:hypothetical protein
MLNKFLKISLVIKFSVIYFNSCMRQWFYPCAPSKASNIYIGCSSPIYIREELWGGSQVCNNIYVILRLGGEFIVKFNVFIISIPSLIHYQFPTWY